MTCPDCDPETGEIMDAVEICGDPSPYGDPTVCTREAGHPERLMCGDGNATWKRGTKAAES